MSSRWMWIAILVLGIVFRVALVWRPADHRSLFPWRESDYTSIARSFYSEGINILYPRVDWRGETSGFVEMEFPALPWVAALLYHAVGYHEELLRVLSAICSILSLFAFAALARDLLPRGGALAATALFAANGLLIALSGAIQPEPLQVLLTILAAHAALRWLRSGVSRELIMAAVWTAGAILAKSPSAFLGLVLAYTVLRRLGLRGFRTPLVYVAASIALVPPLLWYLWAHGHYLSTGLSLGLSNETHFLSWVMLKDPWLWLWIQNMVMVETRDVFMAVGVVLAASALLRVWREIELPVVWYASVIVFYVVTADTSGDPWAYHYHVNSIPPVCLLMGFGFIALRPVSRLTEKFPSLSTPFDIVAKGLLLLTMSAFLARGLQLEYRTLTSSALKPCFICCKHLVSHVPPGELIVVRGGTRVDEHDHPVAYNASMAFAWMERKGFNYAREDFGLETLRSLASRGGVYWIAQPDDRNDSRLPLGAYANLTLVAQCDSFAVYDLRPLLGRPSIVPR